jgi:hypothetical protein
LLNDQGVIDEIKEEIKRFLEVNENENTEPMGHSKGRPKTKVYSHGAYILKCQKYLKSMT